MKLLLITFSLFTVSCSLFTSKKEDKKSKSVNLSTYNALTPKDFVEHLQAFESFYLNSENLGTGGYGLQDIAIKTKMSPAAGWTFKADYHFFSTQTDTSDGDSDTMRSNEGVAVSSGSSMNEARSSDLGEELDLTLVHKYDSNTKIVMGYSHYWTTMTFALLNAGNDAANDNSRWMYVMVDTKF
mgnify:CR=1 FL=1